MENNKLYINCQQNDKNNPHFFQLLLDQTILSGGNKVV